MFTASMVDIQHLADFVRSIGIPVTEVLIDEKTFLPGILIKDGGLCIDRKQLLYPGDILHEAGHLAVMLPAERPMAGNNVGEHKSQNTALGEEMMAIGWSYAALVHLRLPPEVVFHPAGYRGSSSWFIEQYTSGNHLSLPLLQWAGMCYDAGNAHLHGTQPYPHMVRWLRE